MHVFRVRASWFSLVDTFEEDFPKRYPLTAKAKYLEFDQLPGDLLIIPTGWFHQVSGGHELSM